MPVLREILLLVLCKCCKTNILSEGFPLEGAISYPTRAGEGWPGGKPRPGNCPGNLLLGPPLRLPPFHENVGLLSGFHYKRKRFQRFPTFLGAAANHPVNSAKWPAGAPLVARGGGLAGSSPFSPKSWLPSRLGTALGPPPEPRFPHRKGSRNPFFGPSYLGYRSVT